MGTETSLQGPRGGVARARQWGLGDQAGAWGLPQSWGPPRASSTGEQGQICILAKHSVAPVEYRVGGYPWGGEGWTRPWWGVPGKKENIPEKTGRGCGEWRGLGSAARAACEVAAGGNCRRTVTGAGEQGCRAGRAWCEPPPWALGPQPWQLLRECECGEQEAPGDSTGSLEVTEEGG